jgi:hypothetical protein
MISYKALPSSVLGWMLVQLGGSKAAGMFREMMKD